MTDTTLTLNDWMEKISKAKTRKEIFSILDQFRVLEWTDDERARIAKHYIRIIDNVAKGEPDDDTTSDANNKPVAEGEDGPVWYEKM